MCHILIFTLSSVQVKLEQYPKSHSFAGTQWADNIVAFHTERSVFLSS